MKISKILLASLIASSMSCGENNVVEQAETNVISTQITDSVTVTNVDTSTQEEPVEKLKPCTLKPPPPPAPAKIPEVDYNFNEKECPGCGMG